MVILGTGYKSELSFLDENLLKELSYNYEKGSLNLDKKNVFNASIKKLAFIGFQYHSLFTTFELQARLAMQYFLNEYKPIQLFYRPSPNHKACHLNSIEILAELIGCTSS